jgi:hypothetical protein
MLNISHKQTTSYHPESSGAVESLHHCLKDTLCACAAAATLSEELPFVLLKLRVQLREDIGLSLAEAVFVAQIVLPNEFLENADFQLILLSKIFPKPCMFRLLFAGLVFRPAGVFTFFFLGAATRPLSVLLLGEEVFAGPGPAAPSQPPRTQYPSRQRAPPEVLDL